MRTLLTLCVLGLMAVGAVAEDIDYYWVVGSFKTESAARNEGRRIETITGLAVEISEVGVSGGTLYRLLVDRAADPERQKQVLVNAGLSPWRATAGAGPAEAGAARYAPVAAQTEWQHVLVVGSFNSLSLAEAYAKDLASRSSESVVAIPGTASGRNVFRVVLGPYSSRVSMAEQRASEFGVSGAWWLRTPSQTPMDIARVTVPAVKADITPVVPEVVPEIVPEVVPEVAGLRAPKPNESYFDYCIKKANARERAKYCADQQFAKAALTERQVEKGGGGRMYVDFCTKEASKEQRAKYCTNGTFANRAIPN